MSMRSLATTEMIQLSGTVLMEGTSQHAALLSAPSAAALAPALQGAHDELVAAEAGGDTEALSQDVAGLADRHDELVAQIETRLEAEITAAPSDAERVQLEQARDQIFPHGESILRASYSAKAGARAAREHRVSAQTLALLATIPRRGGGSLADTYGELQSVSLSLHETEAQRQAMFAAHAGPRVRQARKRWVAAVEAIDRSMRAAGLDPSPVLGGIREAQAKAHPASSDAAQPATPAHPAAPAPTPTTPTPTPAVTNGSTPHA